MTHINSSGTWTYNRSPNIGQKIRSFNNQEKKTRTFKIVDVFVSVELRIKLKESEKKYNYLGLARELKKNTEHEGDSYTNRDWCFWNSHQRIFKGIRGHGKWRKSGDFQTTALLRTARILRRILQTWGDLLFSYSSENLLTKTEGKNSQVLNDNNKHNLNSKPIKD